jgi:major membrane immunogen (membrane-anchored lipoprotein)
MTQFRLLSIVCVIVCLALLTGCSKKEDDSSAEPNTETELSSQVPTESIREGPKEASTIMSSTEGTLFKDVLALWETDQKDEAVKQFLSIKWGDPSVFQGIQVMNMSEQELRSLPQDEMKRIAGEAHELTLKMRRLMFYVSSIGDKHVSSGDIQVAKKHFEAVRLYGEALSQPERFEVIRMVGKAIVAYGQKKLSGIE